MPGTSLPLPLVLLEVLCTPAVHALRACGLPPVRPRLRPVLLGAHCPTHHRLAGLLAAGVAGHAHKHWGSDFTTRAITVRVLALVMLLISIFMAIYAAVNFKRRGEMLL